MIKILFNKFSNCIILLSNKHQALYLTCDVQNLLYAKFSLFFTGSDWIDLND